MNTAPVITRMQKWEEPVSISASQYIADPPRWRLLIPNLSSTMSTIPISALMLLAGAGLMMSEREQLMLIGSVLAGSALGSVFQVLRTIATKTEEDCPRQIIIYRFLSHAAGGSFFGVLMCLAMIHWFKMEMPLILMGVGAGGLMGWLCEVVAKKFEPKILDLLERTGRIAKPSPPETKTIYIGKVKESPSTVNLTAPKDPPQ